MSRCRQDLDQGSDVHFDEAPDGSSSGPRRAPPDREKLRPPATMTPLRASSSANEPDAANVGIAVFPAVPEPFRQIGSHDIAVEQFHPGARCLQPVVHDFADGALAGAGQTGEPERETLVCQFDRISRSSTSTERSTFPSALKCRPHSELPSCSHHQRPARAASPATVARVHGPHPMLV